MKSEFCEKNIFNEAEQKKFLFYFNDLMKGFTINLQYLFIIFIIDVELKFDSLNEDKFLKNFIEFLDLIHSKENKDNKKTEFIEY